MKISIDTHVHLRISKKFPFSLVDFTSHMNYARMKGLDAIVALEHIHAVEFWKGIDMLISNYEYVDNKLILSPDFYAVLGVEVTTSDNTDIVIIGTLEELKILDASFVTKLSAGYKPSVEELLTVKNDLLFIAAHPTRPYKNFFGVEEKLITMFDALEINGKDGDDGKVRKWAKKLKLPVVGGSDTHVWPQFGICRTIVPQHGDIKTMLRTQPLEVECIADAKFIVETCKQYKQIWKKNYL